MVDVQPIESISIEIQASPSPSTIVISGGSTMDYTLLSNKPQINSVVLNGNKSSSDLGLASSTALSSHISDTLNPHSVTATQVGLNNVDNVQQLPLSYLDTDSTFTANSDTKVPSQKAVKTALDLKVDKVTGKGLSTNDLTDTLKTNYDTAYTNNHTHSNKDLLDDLVSNGAGTQFLADDGTYKTISTTNLTLATSDMPTMANNSSDANNDIDFSAGFCCDSTLAVKITNTAMTKQLDASWSAGTNAGGLDTGSKANSTWYHCFAISKADGTSDFLFSTSSTSPTMPTDYVNKRRIGAIKTDGSTNIIAFKQKGDAFYWGTPIQDVYLSGTLPTSATLYNMSVPPSCEGLFYLEAYSGSGAGAITHYLYSPVTSALRAGVSYDGSISWRVAFDRKILCNSSSQVYYYGSASSGYAIIYTIGYSDTRGVN